MVLFWYRLVKGGAKTIDDVPEKWKMEVEEMRVLERLLKAKKLTERQRKALEKLIEVYWYMVD